MNEPIGEPKSFRPASREWFDKSLDSSPYFKTLDVLRRNEIYQQFCDQVTSDAELQRKVINTNFVNRPNLSQKVTEKGKISEKEIGTLLLSPPLMAEDCPLETKVDENWSLPRNSDQATISGLLEDFVHDESEHFEYAPVAQKGESHAYARYDIAKHPRVQEYIAMIRKLVQSDLPEGTDSSQLKTLLVRTGSSIFPDILQILNFEGRKHVISPQNERFLIQILSESPYFEAGKAIKAMQPVHALDFDTWTFFPPTSEGLSGPSAEVISTESNSPHLQKIDMSLREGGICCFYVEPIGNNPSMDVPNLRKAVETIRAAKKINQDARKIFIVIDSSIMGGDFDLKSIFKSEDFMDMNLVVIESVNKFLSYGTNKANLGFTYGIGPDTEWFFDSLQNTIQMKGLPDFRSVLSVPLPEKEIVETRRNRFKQNAEFLTSNLASEFLGKLEIIHPSLKTHPQHERADHGYDFQGSIFFVKLPNKEAYEKAEKLLGESEVIGLGTSYGFNNTRAEVIKRKTDSQKKEPIALRVSVGTENIRQLILIQDELRKILQEALKNN